MLALLLVSVLGASGGGDPPPAAPIQLTDGIPLGVEHSRAGVLAASDNYLALASQSVEQDPAAFASLVAHVYDPAARSRALAEAARMRAGDSQDMGNYNEGGRGIAVVAARRLDSYTPARATVTSWLGGFVWGPRFPPRQSWNLVDTTLRWAAGRWQVLDSHTVATPAPVPSIVYVQAHNDRSPAFARLAGMTAPFYGTGR